MKARRTTTHDILKTTVANAPLYSIKKSPEPKTCSKFVLMIVFRVPSRGARNCRKFVQTLKNQSVSLDSSPKNNRQDKLWTNLSFGAFLNAIRDWSLRKTTHFQSTTSFKFLRKPQKPQEPRDAIIENNPLIKTTPFRLSDLLRGRKRSPPPQSQPY